MPALPIRRLNRSTPPLASRALAALLLAAWQVLAASAAERTVVAPQALAEPGRVVEPAAMQRVYEAARTPFKYGPVLRPGPDESIDCANIFRAQNRWYMVYVAIRKQVGYETRLAASDDLLHWEPLGTVLPFAADGWDRWQADGSLALVDPEWGGSLALQPYDGKYWMSYFGGAKQGYETDPLSIGMAWTDAPTEPKPWRRLAENPVLTPEQSDARPFEQATLYKSQIVWDRDKSLGYPFVMFYNGKQRGEGTERIGMAVSHDLVNWSRYGAGPVIDNGRGISGDPQIVRMGELWVMFYFGFQWRPGAFDTFACSYDLVHWTKWEGDPLVAPSEPWDKTFAHKPWMIRHGGVTYHFYCAVGKEGRLIALATSRDMKK